MRSKKLPYSTATNAYDLLTDVAKLIVEEPKRYNQNRYIARKNGAGGADDPTMESFIGVGGEYKRGLPACGTVGCVAGWVATLVKGDDFNYLGAHHITKETLGLSDEQMKPLISAAAVTGKPQTKEYALKGAQHIITFRNIHAEQLKDKKVTISKKVTIRRQK